jgi:hypothetical protein
VTDSAQRDGTLSARDFENATLLFPERVLEVNTFVILAPFSDKHPINEEYYYLLRCDAV